MEISGAYTAYDKYEILCKMILSLDSHLLLFILWSICLYKVARNMAREISEDDLHEQCGTTIMEYSTIWKPCRGNQPCTHYTKDCKIAKKKRALYTSHSITDPIQICDPPVESYPLTITITRYSLLHCIHTELLISTHVFTLFKSLFLF